MHSTGLLTDHYELTMLQAALRSGTADRPSVFEMFARQLPEGRRYGVVAGTGRILDALEAFHFEADDLDFLRGQDVVDEATLGWLASYRFTGDIWGYAEGDVFFPGSPLLVVEASFAEAVVLETVLLSILNHDSAVAAAASRMTMAAEGRPCIEMGARRTHEWAAVAAARAAYIGGFSTSSNLAAGATYGVPTAGTAAHSFTLVHDTERDAFVAQVAALGPQTTLLVDTYDVREAVALAVEVAGTNLGAIRIDSGDLGLLARAVRRQLDELGATATRIIVTGDLDEFSIAALGSAPVDGYGVGTSLVTGSGHPTCGLVYKLVARAPSARPGAEVVAVAKRSARKGSIGGRKWAMRRQSPEGVAEVEVVGIGRRPDDAHQVGDQRGNHHGSHRDRGRDLLVPLVRRGQVVGREPLADARARHQAAVAELPVEARKLSRGEPAIVTTYEDERSDAYPGASR